MLTPDYIGHLPDAMVKLYGQVEQDILADMARRISTYDYFIPAAQHQLRVLKAAGEVEEAILQELAAKTGVSWKQLEAIFQAAGVKTVEFDDHVYRLQGLNPSTLAASKEMQAILAAGLKQTKGLFQNLTRTTAHTASGQFEAALDRAWLQISSGAFDYNTAIRTAVKDLSRQGLGAIRYPTGHVDTLETAVRRAVVTGVNQTCGKVQEQLADEMGCDLMELTAHAGARPDHAVWQGRIVSRSGQSGYLSLSDIGYGTGVGFKGWNCRHDWNPYFEGSPRTYTDNMLKSFDEPKYDYNGSRLTEYEASQQQRSIERKIRRWKRENTAMEAAGLDGSESAAKLRQWQDTQKDFLRQTGLKREGDREQIAGWGRGDAARAAQQARLPEEVLKFNRTHRAKTSSDRLPMWGEARTPDAKLSGYALNMDHPSGHDKAVAFKSALGYTVDNQGQLISQIREGLAIYRATERPITEYGRPFEVPMMLKGVNGNYAKVKTGWQIDKGAEVPRLVTLYVDD